MLLQGGLPLASPLPQCRVRVPSSNEQARGRGDCDARTTCCGRAQSEGPRPATGNSHLLLHPEMLQRHTSYKMWAQGVLGKVFPHRNLGSMVPKYPCNIYAQLWSTFIREQCRGMRCLSCVVMQESVYVCAGVRGHVVCVVMEQVR